MNASPSLSVIIPAYNKPLMVLMALNSLQAMSSGIVTIEYLVQDDFSEEPMTRYVPPCAASVERNLLNLGFAGNCNAGAERAAGDILFFVNQDVYAVEQLSYGWDIALARTFKDRPEIGIAGPMLAFPDSHVQSVGGLFDIKLQPFHRCLGYSNLFSGEVNKPCYVSWTTGAALAVRKSLFQELAGFDTDYERGYFEDVDFCLRARERGQKIAYIPDCKLVHSVGSTGGSHTFHKNKQLFFDRWVATGKIQPDVYVIKERFW